MMKATSYGSQNTEEEGRAFVRREIVPPPSRGARSRASARKRVIAGASAVLVGAAVAATCGYVALSSAPASRTEDTVAFPAKPLSLEASTLLQSLATQVGLDDVATFDSLDIDGDGFVTEEEYVGRLEKRRDDVLAKLTQSNLADDAKQPVAAIIRDNFDTEAACVSRVFDSSGNKAVDRDAFTIVHPLVVSFCKKPETGALTSGIIPANPDLTPANPDQEQGAGGAGETIDGEPTSPGGGGETIDGDVPSPTSPDYGGETIDGDVPSPTSPGDEGETIDGDVPSPTEPQGGETIDGDVPFPATDAPTVNVDGDDIDTPKETPQAPTYDDTEGGDVTEPPSNPDDDAFLTDSPLPYTESSSVGETEEPPSRTDVPIDDSLPGEQISPQPGLPGTPVTYDDNNVEGSGLGDTTSEPSDAPGATTAPTDGDDGPTGDDITPTTDAPGDDSTVDTPSSDAAGPTDILPPEGDDSTSTPSSPADSGGDPSQPSEPDSPPSDDSTTTDEPDTPPQDGSTSSNDNTTVTDEPDAPPSNGSGVSSDTPGTDQPDTPVSETPEPWDPSTPSDPNVDAADITQGPVVWDPSEPTMPPSDEVTDTPSDNQPVPSGDSPSGSDLSDGSNQSNATTSAPGSLTAEIDNALKDLVLPNDGTNDTTGGTNDDPSVIQKFLNELNPNSTDNGSNSTEPEEIKSAQRIAFEEALKKQLKHEIKDHAQRLAYANLQIKKNAFMLELIEECVTHAGRRFELDPSFTSEQAISWIKTDCLVFPHNVVQDPSHK